jgi:error-prone DNA polymerase
MGFYSASQLIQDVKRHGVQVLSVDVTQSEWDCTIEENQSGLDLRLGLRLIKHLSRSGAMRLTRARRQTDFTSLEDLRHRADLDQRDLQALAGADALFNLIRGHRKQAGWVASGVEKPSPIFPALKIREALPMLRAPQAGESVCADYASLGLTLGPHPLALLRDNLERLGALSSQVVNNLEDGCLVHTAGIVTVRQKPSSAKSVTFISLEDENGSINLIVWQALATQQHQTLIGSRLLGVYGKVQKEGQVTHVIAYRLKDYTRLLGDLTTDSRDFQ